MIRPFARGYINLTKDTSVADMYTRGDKGQVYTVILDKGANILDLRGQAYTKTGGPYPVPKLDDKAVTALVKANPEKATAIRKLANALKDYPEGSSYAALEVATGLSMFDTMGPFSYISKVITADMFKKAGYDAIRYWEHSPMPNSSDVALAVLDPKKLKIKAVGGETTGPAPPMEIDLTDKPVAPKAAASDDIPYWKKTLLGVIENDAIDTRPGFSPDGSEILQHSDYWGKPIHPGKRFTIEHDGFVYWDDVPTVDDAFKAEDYMAQEGMEFKAHSSGGYVYKPNPKTGEMEKYGNVHRLYGGKSGVTIGPTDTLGNTPSAPKSKPKPNIREVMYHGAASGAKFDKFTEPSMTGLSAVGAGPFPDLIHLSDNSSLAKEYAHIPRGAGNDPHLFKIETNINPDRLVDFTDIFENGIDAVTLNKLKKGNPGVDFDEFNRLIKSYGDNWVAEAQKLTGAPRIDTGWDLMDAFMTRERLRNAGIDAIRYMDDSPEMEGEALAIVNPKVIQVLSKRRLKKGK